VDVTCALTWNTVTLHKSLQYTVQRNGGRKRQRKGMEEGMGGRKLKTKDRCVISIIPL
jgi:hypothetical protein